MGDYQLPREDPALWSSMFTVTVTCTRTYGAVNAIFILLMNRRFGSIILEAKCHSAFH